MHRGERLWHVAHPWKTGKTTRIPETSQPKTNAPRPRTAIAAAPTLVSAAFARGPIRGATEVRRYALVFCLFFLSVAAYAQSPPPLLPAGDAAVAGFSGTVVFGSPPPPEAKRIDNTYIDLDGPALRVMALGRMGGPPLGASSSLHPGRSRRPPARSARSFRLRSTTRTRRTSTSLRAPPMDCQSSYLTPTATGCRIVRAAARRMRPLCQVCSGR